MKPVVLFAVLVVAGCAGLPRPEATVSVYDFGPPARLGKDETPKGSVLALEMRAAPWLDAPNITYRLAYDDPLKRRHYNESRWASAPVNLLAQHLREKAGLVSANAGQSASCVVRFSLREFSQVFDTPQESHAIVQGQADVIDGKRLLLAGRTLRVEAGAASPDAQGGANGLVTASGLLADQLNDWLEQLEHSGILKGCSSRPGDRR